LFRYRRKIENPLRNGIALAEDFFRIFEQDMQPLYRLAFLLTVNHSSAHDCFVSGLDDACSGSSVFKDWARSWSKRIIIKRCLQLVLAGEARERDLWGSSNRQANEAVDAVTRLPVLERFVFVVSVLEGYSDRECWVLLGCTREVLADVRANAVVHLAAILGPRQSDRSTLASQQSNPVQ
jgi:hypothetical protein